jgi:hypothetical protein
MHLTRPVTLSRRRPRRTFKRRAKVLVSTARERDQRANVSEDAAMYTCCCGYIFRAEVTTSVGCPHCGTDQAW